MAIHQSAGGEGTDRPRVLLVCPPFAYVHHPSLAIGLLKAALNRRSIDCDALYLNISFARQVGLRHYQEVARSDPTLLLGDWVFAEQAFGPDPGHDRRYHELLAAAGGDPELARLLGRLRSRAAAFVDGSLSAVPWSRYRVVGFSTTFQQTTASLALAAEIKKRWPKTTIIFGGANCEGEMGTELHRRFPSIDLVCRGEADNLLPDVVESILSGHPIRERPGLVLRHGQETVPVWAGAVMVSDLDRLPYPDYDDYFEQLRSSSLDVSSAMSLTFESSRGCWYASSRPCAFCGQNGLRHSHRTKGATRMLEELVELTKRYGVMSLRAVDRAVHPRLLRDLMPKLASRDEGWSLFCQVNPNLGKEELRLLGRAGVKWIQTGIESLSSRILRQMRKSGDLLSNVQFLKWAAEAEVDVVWALITGIPGEEPAEYDRMAEIVPSLFHLAPPGACRPIWLDRHSAYHDEQEAFGLTGVRPSPFYEPVYRLPRESIERLAHFFEFDHAGGRDPEVYTAPLREQINRWRAQHRPGSLTFEDDGETTIVHDWRPVARVHRHELTGVARAAYLFFDEAATLADAVEHLRNCGHDADADGIAEILAPWVDARLMLEENGSFLSLAVQVAGDTRK